MLKYQTTKLVLYTTFLLFSFSSCYTKRMKPDYKFMEMVTQQSRLNDSLKTTITISPKTFKFDTIQDNNHIRGMFFIKNTGNKDFNIVSITPSCDCIDVSFLKIKAIHSGDSLQVNYIMNINNKKGKFSNAIVAVGNCQFGNQTYFFTGYIF